MTFVSPLRGKGYLPFKRCLDVIGSLVGIILFSPVLIVVACKVKKNLGSPVIFTQPRPGRGEKVFNLYKFRSMKDAIGHDGAPLPDEERLTPFGRRLRSTSLDELPELFNVLRGDMSLVGPRPLLVKYLPFYNATQHRRHEVRPGITGLAQVNGRNAISWEEKFIYDVSYVDGISFWLDIKILCRTIRAVVLRQGITGPGCESVEPFTGTKEQRQ